MLTDWQFVLKDRLIEAETMTHSLLVIIYEANTDTAIEWATEN